MKIIFNKELRKLYNNLNRMNIKYQDFMLTKDILPLNNNAITFISSIQYLNINKEQFNFLLDLYKNNNNLFIKVCDLIRRNINFDSNEIKLYFDNKDIYEYLINIKKGNIKLDCLNQKYIDTWGEKLIRENYDILPYLDYEEINKYSTIIKNNPSILRNILPLLNSVDNKKYVKDILLISDKTNIKEITNNIIKLKDNTLKEYYLKNTNDKELESFINQIINKKNGYLEIDYNKDAIKTLTETFNISKELSKKLFYNKISNIKNNDIDFIENAVSQILFNTTPDNISDSYYIMNEAIQYNYPIPEQFKVLYDFISISNENKMSDEKLLEIAYNEIYNNSINFDFNKVIKWIKEFKSYQLNSTNINVKNIEINYYEKYTYHDENNNIITKNIPIIEMDNPNFTALVHNVTLKDKTTSPANYKITEELLNNPELWEKTKNGNPNISMSYLNKEIALFKTGTDFITLGFTQIEPERLEMTTTNDGGTSMTKTFDENEFYFVPHDVLKRQSNLYGKKGYGYNEILVKRYKNQKVKNPDYIIVVEGADNKYNTQLAKKWASYFNIPIVKFDAKKLKEYHINEYNTLLNKLKQNHQINNYEEIYKIYEEQGLIKNYSRICDSYNNPTLFKSFYEITKNIDLNNYKNITYISQLLNHLGTEKWIKNGYTLNKKDFNYHPFLTAEELKQMEEYVNSIKIKCSEVLNENLYETSKER